MKQFSFDFFSHISFSYENRIQRLRINAKDHMAQSQRLDPENPFFEVFVCPELGILRCGGIEIFGKCFCLFTNFIASNIFLPF